MTESEIITQDIFDSLSEDLKEISSLLASSIKTLKQVGDVVLEIHGQFANHTLLNQSTHKSTLDNFAKNNMQIKKKVFFLYTCAMDRDGFTDSIKEIALEKEAVILGEYGCKGYNTYGPWKVIGGMNKKHPNEAEVESAVEFFNKLCNR